MTSRIADDCFVRGSGKELVHDAIKGEMKMAEPVDNYVAWCRFTDKTIVTCDSDAEGAFRVYRHADSNRVRLLEKYEAAVNALLNAEHYDHFAARMSDGELEAIETMKSLAAWQEFVNTPTAP